MGEKLLDIEVVAGTAERQMLIALTVPEGTTVAQAVERSRVAEHLPGLTVDPGRLGVFGKRRPPDSEVANGDRVEVYQPLSADPKEIRRQLAELERRRR